MSRRLPPLNALRAFEAAARNISFTRAALELCVTQGAVSRHVATLEDWAGAPLFVRGRYGIELTGAGQAYFREIKAALDQIEQASSQLQQQPDDRCLRIKISPTFAIRWLVPRLARFHSAHRDIDVQITTSHQRADFDREQVDISIRSEERPPVGPGYRRLFGEILLPVCAPGLLEQGPPLQAPADLANHVLLCSFNRPNDWPIWLNAAGVDHIDGNRGLKFENAALAYQAAIDQLGVMVAHFAFVSDDLLSGRLIAPLSQRAATGGAYVLAYRSDRPKPQRVQVFEEWIVREAQEMEARLGV